MKKNNVSGNGLCDVVIGVVNANYRRQITPLNNRIKPEF